jgi:hypothetical protein
MILVSISKFQNETICEMLISHKKGMKSVYHVHSSEEAEAAQCPSRDEWMNRTQWNIIQTSEGGKF